MTDRVSLFTWYGRGGTASRSPDPMLSHFLGTLEVRLRRLAPAIQSGSDAFKKALLEDVTRALADFWSINKNSSEDAAWNEAYKLERLFSLIEPSESLWQELTRR